MKARQTLSIVTIVGFLRLLTWQAQGADGGASGVKPVPTSVPTVAAPASEDASGAPGEVANSLDRSIGGMVDLITGSKSEIDRAMRPEHSNKPIDRDPALGPAASGRAPAVIDDELVINPTGSNIHEGMSPKGKVEEKGPANNSGTTGEHTVGQ